MATKKVAEAEGVSKKLVVVGNSGVGKTALVLRYVQNTFNSEYPATIGGAYLAKKVTVDDVPVNLQIWDTAGQERFRSMVRIYYRGAAAAILVFDMTEKTSFLKLKDWVTELQTVLGYDLLIAVACNKCDLSSRREVSMEQAQDFAASLGATLFETSAKTNQGVEELFLDLSAKLLQRSEVAEKQGAARVAVAEPQQGAKKEGCC